MLFAGFFEKRRRKQAIDGYLVLLRPKLGRMFGKQDNYTPEQIERAAVAAELPVDYIDIGVAIYATSEDFQQYREENGLPRSYWDVREEIGKLFFNGNSHFTQFNVADYAKSRSDGRPVIEGGSWDGREPGDLDAGGMVGDDSAGSNVAAGGTPQPGGNGHG